MSIYTDAQALVNSMLAPVASGGYGMSVTVNRYSPSQNIGTGVVTKGAVSSTFTAGAVAPPDPRALNTTQGQSLVGQRLRVIKIDGSAATFEPRALDEVVIGSVTYLVKECKIMAPDGTPIVYECSLEAV